MSIVFENRYQFLQLYLVFKKYVSTTASLVRNGKSRQLFWSLVTLSSSSTNQHVLLMVRKIYAPDSVPLMYPSQATTTQMLTINVLSAPPLRNHIRRSYVLNEHN